MSVKLKKLEDQVVVITGASSGTGLVTARLAAARGARLVLAARSENALRELTEELNRGGAQAVYVVCDVSKPEDVREVARTAQETFGGFDTWVNNAGVSIYGKLEDIPVEEMRKLFETNVWGLVYGSLEAVKHLKQRSRKQHGGEYGGALINLGSVLSERAIALQGIYSASKHAVKGFTESLRMELENEGAPVSVTLIKPSAIDTPYARHAKNHMEEAATLPPPVYAPETVARTILYCAEHPKRGAFVGSGGKSLAMLGYYAPSFLDKVMETVFVKQERKDQPPLPLEQNGLDKPAGKLEARGGYEGVVIGSSPYTAASLRPGLAGTLLAGTGFAAALWYASRR